MLNIWKTFKTFSPNTLYELSDLAFKFIKDAIVYRDQVNKLFINIRDIIFTEVVYYENLKKIKDNAFDTNSSRIILRYMEDYTSILFIRQQ